MKKRKLLCTFLVVAMLLSLIPSFAAAAGSDVTALVLPESETWLTRDRRDGNGDYDTSKYSQYYYGKEDFIPTFYTSLKAYSGNREMTVKDISWECETEFDITKNGDYTFKIASYNNSECLIPKSIIDNSTITVHVFDNLITKRGANFYLNCVPSRTKMISATGLKIYDITGCIVLPVLNIAGMYINTASFTGANVIVYAGEAEDTVTGNTRFICDSSRLKAIYCGGNEAAAAYTGNADIKIIGSSQVGSVFGGGNNGEHIGDTVVTLSGSSSITDKFTAGGASCSTSGEVTLNLNDYAIADTIVKGTADSFKICADSDYDLGKIDILSSGADIYVNGRKTEAVTSISPMSIEAHVHAGIPESEIVLCETADIVTGGVKKAVDVTWKSDDYDPYTLGTYEFKMILPDGYCFAKEAMRPTAQVGVEIRDNVSITNIEIPVNKTYLPIGTDTVDFYSSLTAYANVDSHIVEVTLDDIKWTSSDYNSSKTGTYTFIIDPQSIENYFSISSSLLSSKKITVVVDSDKRLYKDASSVISDFPVSITEADGKYFNVADLTGCNTLKYALSTDSIDTSSVKLSSELGIKADSVVMYGGTINHVDAQNFSFTGGTVTDSVTTSSSIIFSMKNDAKLDGIIDLRNTSGKSELDVPYRNVWQIKYPITASSMITINGENMGKYRSVQPAVSGTSVFCSGVPCYVDIASDGETYLYRSCDDSRFYASPITYLTVFGGANEGTTVNTNLVINGGILYNAYGGPNAGSVTGISVFIQNGGTVRYFVRGAGDAKSFVENVYAEVNGGYSGKIFSLTGRESVVGSADKVYADDEFCATLIWNGGYSREIHLANNLYAFDPTVNTVYGNTKFVMNDGVAYGIYCGMYRGTTYSNYDVTINGGIIQGELIQDSLGTASGFTKMHLYNGFPDTLLIIKDYSRISVETMEDVSFSYGLGSYVTDNSVFDTSEDKGKLTFRYLEMRLDSEPKDSTYIPTKTGDATLVTFPDGKTMLIDSGTSNCGTVLVRTLRNLGIETLDYLAVSHYHSDHTGGLSEVMKSFEVDTLLLPNLQVSLDSTYTAAITVFDKYPDTKRVYLKSGDILNIGGVTINIYNPDTDFTELDSYATEEANNYSVLMKFIYGNDTALMTGDLYEAQEKALAAKYTNGELDCDLLKVMHHGGFTSSYYEFYNAISPTYSVVTNTQSQRVDNLCTKYLIDNLYKTPYYYATGDNGMVKASLTGNGIIITPQYRYGFTDTDSGAWYSEYVNHVNESGLMGGSSEHSFEPSSALTRGMFVTILARLDGSTTDKSVSDFTDVSSSSWYSPSVAWAAQIGLVGGVGNGRFEPDRKITRQEMAVMIYNYLTYREAVLPETTETVYNDSSNIADWATNAVSFCTDLGILGGSDGSFLPQNTATRAEAAAIFTRLSK